MASFDNDYEEALVDSLEMILNNGTKGATVEITDVEAGVTALRRLIGGLRVDYNIKIIFELYGVDTGDVFGVVNGVLVAATLGSSLLENIVNNALVARLGDGATTVGVSELEIDEDGLVITEFNNFAPTVAPSVSPGDDDIALCFAGSETVLLESGATKTISDVELGDMVQVVSGDGSLAFSEVVFLPHSANTQKATFVELELTSGNSLRATPAHFVLAGACGADAFQLTAMKDIAEGSCVQTANGEDRVTGNTRVIDHGIYTVVTKESSGLVVVNGIRAFSFGHNHWLVSKYYNIHRLVYEVAPSLLKSRIVVAANLLVGDIAMMSL
jgi:hypothetical protein